MGSVQLELDAEIVALLQPLNRPIQQSAMELIVLELYRRGAISSGKAGELLGMSRRAFIEHAAKLDLPFFEMTADEWEAEQTQSRSL